MNRSVCVSWGVVSLVGVLLATALIGGCPSNVQLPDVNAGQFNQPPRANAGPDKSTTVGGRVELDGGASTDPDGDALSYAWTQTAGGPVTLQNANQRVATFVAPSPGDYDFLLTVSDGKSTDTDTVRISVATDTDDGDDDSGGADADDNAGDDGADDGDDNDDADDGDNDDGDDGDGNGDDGDPDDGDDGNDGDDNVDGGMNAQIRFRALYDWILDDDQLGEAINKVAISGDGKVIAFTNGNADTGRKLYTINPDGSGMSAYACPNGTGALSYLAISQNGGRVFAASMYDRKIYKLEGNQITTIDVSLPNNGPTGIRAMRCTSSGDYVWFQDDYRIWRAAHNTNGCQMMVDRDAGMGGYKVWTFDLAGDGTRVAFVHWFSNPDKYKLLLWENGAINVLLDNNHTLNDVRISRDGSTIAYQDYTDSRFQRIRLTGGAASELAASGNNYAGSMLTADGGQFFYNDTAASGGRRVDCEDSSILEIMPDWNVGTITINILDNLCVSDDGSMIVFRHEYATWPFKRCIYVGYFNDPDAVADAPRIQSVSFNPGKMPQSGDDAHVVLTAHVTDADGNDDITVVTPDEFLDGLKQGDAQNLPAYFYHSARDDGEEHDPVAGDGYWSAWGQPGGKASELDEMTIRVGVKDSTNTVVIADVMLAMQP